MEQLLSGLIGALIATTLSVVYLHFSEKSKIRTEVLLEIVGFCDDIYHHLQNLQFYKEAKYNDRSSDLSIEDYRQLSRELTVLLISTKVHAKLAIAYGEGDELALFLELSKQLRRAASILRKATRSGWVKEGPQIHQLFENEIDPLRHNLMSTLIDGTRPNGILLNLIKCYMPTFFKIKSKIKGCDT